VRITSVSGRTLSVYKGKGSTAIDLGPKMSGAGIYFAVISSKNGKEIRRFIMN
jgi:hypothetical protein